ncbi:hypothetical protein C8A05DRAFT_42090 [Staphylotrichum tortipilum]|uniref:Uncharacterized protein n=1 Tax=Staphylotrichum tortipilum TaxID=2831512 RepID=A0AAN6MR33_9PEZI|nr:hypothetical protein C8A05DRAFT_42090 [Staphylotrichum longicolle]
MNPIPLAGRTAVVTGGAGGIGLAVARRFAQEGANVVLAGRTRASLIAAQQTLEQTKPWAPLPTPAVHSIFCLNVADPIGWDALPTITILTNAAGSSQASLLRRLSPATTHALLATNLTGAVLGCQIVGKQMMSHRRLPGRCIINVSSLLARRAVEGTSVYAAAKAGQLGLTTSLSHELGRFGIRVNAIVPGYIDTAMTEDLSKKPQLIDRIPLRRFGTPDEVADAAAFLAKNEYANNCVLNLDGGLSAMTL